MLEVERSSREKVGVGVGYLVLCWPQEPAQHYSTLILVELAIKVLLEQYLHCTGKCLYPAHLL